MYMQGIQDGYGMFSTMLDRRLVEKFSRGLDIDFMEHRKLMDYITEMDTCPDHVSQQFSFPSSPDHPRVYKIHDNLGEGKSVICPYYWSRRLKYFVV